MIPQRRFSDFLMFVSILILCSGCGGSGGGGTTTPTQGTLPWTGSFLEASPAAGDLTLIAQTIEVEIRAHVPGATRQAISDHIADTLSHKSVPHLTKADPPRYQIAPENECDAFMMAGNGAVLQGDLNLGIWAFSRAVLADPLNAYAMNQFGWSLLASERYSDAKQFLLGLTRSNPELWTAWSSLGSLYEHDDDPERASYCYQMALMSHPDSVFINIKLGALLLRQGDVTGAALHAGQALSVNPRNDEALALKEQIEAAGGAVIPVEPPGVRLPLSRAASEVRSEIGHCSEEHTGWMMEQMIPVVNDAYRDGMAHENNRALIGQSYAQCEQLCMEDPDAGLDCWFICDMDYCSRMAAEITRQHSRNIGYINIEIGLAAAYRARYRSCSYDAIEDRINELSPSDITALYDFVDWQVQMSESSYTTAIDDEIAFYKEELAGISSACEQDAIAEALAAMTPEGERGPLFDTGMEACADGFFCLTFGEESIGFSAGVGFASGGLTADYGTTDLIFSLGVAADSGVAAIGIDAKLSIRRGFGLSPVAKFGGPIRATVSRDYWLYSF
ncbi:MAG: hypothetical protein KKD44_07500 [Proteobacteria bacterium]|nr:hypothetical protein [Pseudomonadota bacterium]